MRSTGQKRSKTSEQPGPKKWKKAKNDENQLLTASKLNLTEIGRLLQNEWK
jgi:hypothetical protein